MSVVFRYFFKYKFTLFMAESRKPRYEESDLRALDRNIRFSNEILRAIETFRANNPSQSSLSDADIIRYYYFNFYSDINPDTFIALLGEKSNGSVVNDTATAETAPNPLTGGNRFFSRLDSFFSRLFRTGSIIIILAIILYLFFFVSRNEVLVPSADSAGNPQDDYDADRAEKKSRYLYNNSGVDMKFLYAVDTQGASRLLGHLSAGNDGYFDIAVSEFFVGCDPDGVRYVVFNNSDAELFITPTNAAGRC